jgi:hypothetical protein
MPESVFTQTMPLLLAGGVCCAAVAAAGFDEVVEAGVAAGAAAGADAGFAAGALAGAAAGAGADALDALDFSDFEDFFEGVVAVGSEPPGVGEAVSAVSAFLLFLDLLGLDVSAEAAVLVSAASVDFFDLEVLPVEASAAAEESAASDFFDFEDFLELDASAVAEESGASDFFDFDDFFDPALSDAAEESAVSAFLLFADFLLEVSELELSSVVALFFFFFALVVLLSLWSLDCVDCDVWAAAGRTVTLPAASKNAASNARYQVMRVRFIKLNSFRAPRFIPPFSTRWGVLGASEGRKGPPRGGSSGGIGGMMCEKKGEVKEGIGSRRRMGQSDRAATLTLPPAGACPRPD